MDSSFLQFMQQMMAQGGGGPMPEPAPTPPMGTQTEGVSMAPRIGEPGGDTDIVNLLRMLMAVSMRGKAGDLYDANNEMGGSPVQGLFGQAPVPLRQPPPGIDQRRRGMP
jgi:hypothetical protein